MPLKKSDTMLSSFGSDIIDAKDGVSMNDYSNGGPEVDTCSGDPDYAYEC